jgi:Na+-transporting methylmalonyl-CoA/oxaloacetate decarboxylase gamma subunit
MLDWLLSNTHPSVDWNYAMITLVMRFIGVFIVLAFIQIALQAASRVVRRIERRGQQPEIVPEQDAVPSEPPPADTEEQIMDAATAAVVAMALEMEYEVVQVAGDSASGPSAWAIAGRMNQVRLH